MVICHGAQQEWNSIMSEMKLLYLHDSDDRMTPLAGDLEREDAVLCSRIPIAIDCLLEGRFDGIVLPWRTLVEVRKRPAAEQALFDAHPMLVLLEDFPPESVLGLSLRIIEQGGDDSLVAQHSDAASVVERLKVAKLRRQFENAPVCAVHADSFQWSSGLLPDVVQPGTRPYAKGWSWHKRPLHILLLDGDSDAARRTSQWLENNTSSIVTLGRLEEAEVQLKEEMFDVALVDWSMVEDQRAQVLQLLQHHAEEIAFVVTSMPSDWSEKEMVLSAGAQDCLLESQENGDELWRTLLCSAARQRRRHLTSKMSSVDGQQSSLSYVDPPQERRRSPRYILTKSIVVIPILPDQSPDGAFRGEGFTCNISDSGLAFEVVGLNHLPGRYMLAGIEADDGIIYYATVEVRNRQQEEGRFRIGACFAPPEKDLLQPSNLLPNLQSNNYRFDTGLPPETLKQWVQIGVLQPFLADQQLLCPKCHALSTFRRGCKHCGSIHITKSQLIHHFACAYVGFTGGFQHGDEIICPKCRTRNLVVGADFEYLQGPYHCMDCNWSETELETVGFCLACHWRYALHQAWEQELIGYHVNRMEPLALINST
jgi:DNA-binding NarL/FixJ family response regulator